MKKLTFTWLSFTFIFTAFFSIESIQAQSNFNGRINGVLIDKSKSQPVEFANVALRKQGSTDIFKGIVSNEKGEFIFENLPVGNYEVDVFYIGYEKKTIPSISLTWQNAVVRLEKIEMIEDSQKLSEIVIEKEREFIETTSESTIITPSANPTQAGGTATDVLQNAPSVQVDANGNVSMRGGNPNILINGRNSGFGGGRGGGGFGGGGGLDQISADEIQSIEVNTNPSAKFDADGMGGMINIRLKQDRQLGTHGNFNGSIGYRPTGTYNFSGGFRLNHRTDKINFYGGYNGRYDNRVSTDITNRTSEYLTVGSSTVDSLETLNQSRDSDRENQSHNIRLGTDYFFSDKESLSFETMISTRQGTNTGALISKIFDEDNNLRTMSSQDNSSKDNSENIDLSLSYRKEFAKKKQEFSASVNTSLSNGVSTSDLANQMLAEDGTPLNLNPFKRLTENDSKNTNTVAQLDYAHPFGKDGLLEVGYKGIVRTLNTDFNYNTFDYNNNAFTQNQLLSNQFQYFENAQAAYTAFKNRINKIEYSVGLRFEKVWLTGDVNNAEGSAPSNFKKDYFNIFPTARIAYNFSQDEFLKISYSRRIDRPRFDDLNPFQDITNQLNIRQGNPNLNPEYIHVVELGYNRYWDKFSVTPTVFYRYRTNLVQRITEIQDDGITTLSTPQNIGFSEAYGLELSASANLYKWWQLQGSSSFFQTEINAGDNAENSSINSSVMSWNARLNSTFNISKHGLRMQINYFYNSPTAQAQGENRGFYAFGFGMNKSLWNNKGGIGFNVRDIFYTLIWGSTTNGENEIGTNNLVRFNQTSKVFRDTRMFMINFRYRF